MGKDGRAARQAWEFVVREGQDVEGSRQDSQPGGGRLAETARRTRRRAIRYAARYLGDGSQGEEILEDVVRSANGVAGRNTIEKPEGYLFSGVVRRVKTLLSRTPQIEYVGSVLELDGLKAAREAGRADELERHVLIREIIALMDEETRDIHFKRARGDRWNKIGRELGISADAAEERFRYGLEKVRARIVGPENAKARIAANGRGRLTPDPLQPGRT